MSKPIDKENDAQGRQNAGNSGQSAAQKELSDPSRGAVVEVFADHAGKGVQCRDGCLDIHERPGPIGLTAQDFYAVSKLKDKRHYKELGADFFDVINRDKVR